MKKQLPFKRQRHSGGPSSGGPSTFEPESYESPEPTDQSCNPGLKRLGVQDSPWGGSELGDNFEHGTSVFNGQGPFVPPDYNFGIFASPGLDSILISDERSFEKLAEIWNSSLFKDDLSTTQIDDILSSDFLAYIKPAFETLKTVFKNMQETVDSPLPLDDSRKREIDSFFDILSQKEHLILLKPLLKKLISETPLKNKNATFLLMDTVIKKIRKKEQLTRVDKTSLDPYLPSFSSLELLEPIEMSKEDHTTKKFKTSIGKNYLRRKGVKGKGAFKKSKDLKESDDSTSLNAAFSPPSNGVTINQQAPNFSLEDDQGDLVSISQELGPMNENNELIISVDSWQSLKRIMKERFMQHPRENSEFYWYETTTKKLSLWMNLNLATAKCIAIKKRGYRPNIVVQELIREAEQDMSKLDENLKKIKDFVKQIIVSLRELHERGFVHGDVKIENTLVFSDAEEKQIILIDWDSLRVANHRESLNDSPVDPGGSYPKPKGISITNGSRKLNLQEYNDFEQDIFALGVMLSDLLHLEKENKYFRQDSDGFLQRNEHLVAHNIPEIEILYQKVDAIVKRCLAFTISGGKPQQQIKDFYNSLGVYLHNT